MSEKAEGPVGSSNPGRNRTIPHIMSQPWNQWHQFSLHTVDSEADHSKYGFVDWLSVMVARE